MRPTCLHRIALFAIPAFLLLLLALGGLALTDNGKREQAGKPGSWARLKGTYPEREAEREAEIAELSKRSKEWKGVQVVIGPNIAEADLPLYTEVARAFDRTQVPKARREHFEWCLSRPDLTLLGWSARLHRVSKADDGWLAEVDVCPRLHWSAANIATTRDYYMETWKYSKGKLTFVKGVEPPDRLKVLIGN